MAMVIGCFPVTGIPLPFISYGGTSLLTNVISVGLIWGAVISGREKSDIEERRRMIKAMEGQLAPSGRKSLIIFNVYLRSLGITERFFMKV
ncbi:MAG: FtsW/RodA/SpoVE family cell cycle protein [Dialister invisus]